MANTFISRGIERLNKYRADIVNIRKTDIAVLLKIDEYSHTLLHTLYYI